MKVLRPEKEPQVRERARQISMLGTRRMHELRVMRRRRFSQHITYVLRRVPESRWDHDLAARERCWLRAAVCVLCVFYCTPLVITPPSALGFGEAEGGR